MPTTEYRIEPFLYRHMGELLAPVTPALDAGARLYARHPSMLARWRGQALFAAGVVVAYPGMGEAWALVTPQARRHPVYLHRTCLRWLRETIDALRLRRVQATVPVGFDLGQRWLERLGFREEALLRLYGPQGEDMTLWALFPQEDKRATAEARLAEALADR